jgi:hypothetical protein
MKRELDAENKYIPVYAEDADGTQYEVPSQVAYPMRAIIATVKQDKKRGLLVIVSRDDCAEDVVYDSETDGYQYWMSQAVAQGAVEVEAPVEVFVEGAVEEGL